MRHPSTLVRVVMLALIACSGLAEANAASRVQYRTYAERTGSYWRYYGYPRPNCTFAISEYQRFWSAQLWPPSMRCRLILIRACTHKQLRNVGITPYNARVASLANAALALYRLSIFL